MIFSFWLILALIIYCYFGYPLILFVIAKCARNKIHKSDYEPAISIILSIWNEQDVIKEKIENLLSLDYPKEKIEILVGSDGSTDNTNVIVKKFSDPRISLTEGLERRGKMVTLNRLVEKAKNGILVFTDARQSFENNAIKELVNNFSDPKVGCVSGELMFAKKEGATAQGINLYWYYEKFIRRQESNLHSMLGATGAIYAIRRELYTMIPDNIVLDDMFVPLKIIQKGYRAVIDTAAHAYDDVADSPKEEHRRKSRTLFGNYQIFWVFKHMFNPLKSPVAWQLFSHKFLRVTVPFLMIAIFILNAFLVSDPLYNMLFTLQIIFYSMAVIGGLARYQNYGILKIISKLCYIPYVFCLLNFSALIGFLKFARSKQDITWEKARDQ